MKLETKILIALIALIAYGFYTVSSAMAAPGLFWNHESVTGSKAQPIEKIWSGGGAHGRPAACSTTSPYDAPALWYYLDGDTPIETAYSDYLEDLNAHIQDFNLCPITPEPFPAQ